MMKKILFFILCIQSLVFSQEKKVTKNGEVTFEASVPAFEEVKATNNGVSCVLNTETGEIASLALVKGFRFKIALMEEHFNENYAESTKFPKAIFKGKIQNFDLSKLTDKAQKFVINGTLEFHGKKKEIQSEALIKLVNGKIDIVTHFSVNSDDFDIKIPSVVSKKVSKKVNVDSHFVL